MAFTFLVSLVAIALLFTTLCAYELTAKRTRMLLKARSRTLGFQGSPATPSRTPLAAAPRRTAPAPSSAPAPAHDGQISITPPAGAQLR